jgi:hypothetical protein
MAKKRAKKSSAAKRLSAASKKISAGSKRKGGGARKRTAAQTRAWVSNVKKAKAFVAKGGDTV